MSVRKDKIKNITIIFLAIMLVLTFFSNTIMNYSLVEVSTQQVTSGSITSKVRGSGTVAAGESYAVTISEGRKIESVEVKTGAEVATGDVLFRLEDAESTELLEAETALTELETAYETAVLTGGITVAERKAIESGKDVSLTDKQNALESAKIELDNAQATVDNLTKQQATLEATSVDTAAESAALVAAKQAQTAAQNELDNANVAVSSAQNALTLANNAVVNKDAPTATETDAIAKAQKILSDAQSNAADAQTKLNNCIAAVTNAQTALDAKTNSSSIATQIAAIKVQLATAQAALDAATKKNEDLSKSLLARVELAGQYKAIGEQREKVEGLREKSVDTEITSPINGTVTEILYTAGQTVTAEEPMMQIQPENKAFTLDITVTSNQAKKVKVGDAAEIVNNWSGANINAKVITIRRDTTDKQSSVITCEVTGDDVAVGDNYTISIGQQSANYDLIVPTSAIREDSNGSFILSIESKSTPLGNRYYARRVDIEIIASDDTKSAISGALEGYEYIITTTTKTVEANQQVRLAE